MSSSSSPSSNSGSSNSGSSNSAAGARDNDSSEPAPDGLLEIGRIEKVHGLKGEVLVGLVTNLVEARTAIDSELWADGQWLTVRSARSHKNKWLMTFDGVSGRESAESLRGRILRAEPLTADALGTAIAEGSATEIVAYVHDLIGKRLIDQHGRDHGPVMSVVDNPASDLLELADARLVPLAFYRHHDEDTITVEVPPGLLDDDDPQGGDDPGLEP